MAMEFICFKEYLLLILDCEICSVSSGSQFSRTILYGRSEIIRFVAMIIMVDMVCSFKCFGAIAMIIETQSYFKNQRDFYGFGCCLQDLTTNLIGDLLKF